MYRAEKLAAPAVDLLERKEAYKFHMYKVTHMKSDINRFDLMPTPNRIKVHRRNQQVLRNLSKAVYEEEEYVPVPPIPTARSRKLNPRAKKARELEKTKKDNEDWASIFKSIPPKTRRTPVKEKQDPIRQKPADELAPIEENE